MTDDATPTNAPPPGTGAAPPEPAARSPFEEDRQEPERRPGRVARAVAAARARGRHPELAAVLAFLVPGLGHVYLGRHGKGALAFVLLCGLYAAGILESGGECVSLDKANGHYVAFFGQVGAGLPTGLALLHTHRYEVKKWLGKEAEPPEDPTLHPEDPAFVARLPHLDEGLLYTTIAGLLNLLLIYDALLGAPGATLRREEDEPSPDAAAPATTTETAT